MEAPIGPPATLTCELGQARKGATAAGVVCAGMWLVGASTHLAFEKYLSLSKRYILIHSLQCSSILLFCFFIASNNKYSVIIFKLPNYQTTKLPNYQTTKLPNYQTTHIFRPVSVQALFNLSVMCDSNTM